MDDFRELTAHEKIRIKKLVISNCANYSKEYGCLPLDSECYMFGVGFADSKLCKYFKKAVLPLNVELLSLFEKVPTRPCRYCGKKFAAAGKQAYCSEACRSQARRKQTAERVRRYRLNKAEK